MAAILTTVFFAGLLLLLIGYGQPGTRNDSLLLSAGWFFVLWPGLALLAAVPLKIPEKTGRSLSGTFNPERRSLLSNAGSWIAVSAAGPIALHGLGQANEAPAVRMVKVPLEGGPAGLAGFRIAQISDLHLDRWSDPQHVKSLVASINRTRPHLIAMTGDLADDRVSFLREAIAPLSQLAAPFGRFFVTGNHEYRSAAGGVDAWIKEVADHGFLPLLNDHRILSVNSAKLAVCGVNDYDAALSFPAHGSRPTEAAPASGKADYRILLAHQPRSVFQAAEAGFDLQLSGHTHGGQCFPGHLLVSLTQPYLSGLHRMGQTLIYVSPGVGTWGAPVRLGAQAEISLLLLCT